MSKSEALATVTAALRNLLSDDMGGAAITTKSPSVARNGESRSQLNIFLYSVRYSPAFRNEPLPGKAKSGELAYPPMPLILKYLITAYGADNDDISGQILLGKAMRILHDHPLLGQADLKDIVPESGLHEQAERIRITPDTLNLDDMSKLWSSFQSAEYRLSVGYEISVVLIESNRTGKAALPVLKRGEEDRGAQVIPAPMPSLVGLRFLNRKPSAELGDTAILIGEHLSLDNTLVRFQHPLLKHPIEVAPTSVREGNEMEVLLGDMMVNVLEKGSNRCGPPGFYILSLLTKHPDLSISWTSNQLYMPLAPRISVAPLTASPGEVKLTIICTPQIREGQKAALLFGDRIIQSYSIEVLPVTPTEPITRTKLKFTIDDVPAKDKHYTIVVRLRVDGVDSIPVDFASGAPKFDQKQTVTIS